jgi:tRNA-2-methylthio-N6-dimethylallyladenosine synthase
MPSVYIKTYGCQMNERDSEQVAAQLVAKGYSLTNSEAEADVILLNTCSVRDGAERKALGKMATLAADVRRNRPNVVLGFMGCMAQSRGQELLDKLPDLDLVVGTQKFHRAAEYVDDLLSDRREKVLEIDPEPDSQSAIREHVLHGNGARGVTALVSIMQGCNQRCTFCIVPFTRGPERCRSIPDIVGECRQLVSQGVKEVTLLGQIVTSYGRREIKEREGISAYVQLLEALHEVEGLERIRFTSPHPKGYGDDLIEAYGRLPKVVENAHIPLQSGSDRILKLMHRGYTRERFLGIVEKLRRVQPAIGITTDLIVGFPGETEEDFQETLAVAKEVRFDNSYVYKYSVRRDTPAAGMPDQVSQELKEERHRQLLEVINARAAENYDLCLGRTMEVLVEGPSKRNKARMMGRTRCNKIVVFEAPETSRGRLIQMKIVRVGAFTLYGEPVLSSN